MFSLIIQIDKVFIALKLYNLTTFYFAGFDANLRSDIIDFVNNIGVKPEAATNPSRYRDVFGRVSHCSKSKANSKISEKRCVAKEVPVSDKKKLDLEISSKASFESIPTAAAVKNRSAEDFKEKYRNVPSKKPYKKNSKVLKEQFKKSAESRQKRLNILANNSDSKDLDVGDNKFMFKVSTGVNTLRRGSQVNSDVKLNFGTLPDDSVSNLLKNSTLRGDMSSGGFYSKQSIDSGESSKQYNSRNRISNGYSSQSSESKLNNFKESFLNSDDSVGKSTKEFFPSNGLDSRVGNSSLFSSYNSNLIAQPGEILKSSNIPYENTYHKQAPTFYKNEHDVLGQDNPSPNVYPLDNPSSIAYPLGLGQDNSPSNVYPLAYSYASPASLNSMEFQPNNYPHYSIPIVEESYEVLQPKSPTGPAPPLPANYN